MMRSIRAEFLKLKGSRVPIWTALAVVAYSTLPIAGGFAWEKLDATAAFSKVGGAWLEAAERGYYLPTWENLLRQNVQAVAGGVALLLFGFVTAYVFGRERKEGTDATLLTAPVVRWKIGAAKLVVVAAWVLALTVFWFALQTAGFAVFSPSGFSWSLIWRSLGQTLTAAVLVFAMLPLVGFVALVGKPGYLKPMIMAIVLEPTFPAVSTDKAHLVAMTMPVLIDGAAWLPIVDDKLTSVSWAIAAGVFAAGVLAIMWKLGRTSDAV
jgi:hypothetical protein